MTMQEKPRIMALILLILIFHIREIAQIALHIHRSATTRVTFFTVIINLYCIPSLNARYLSMLIAVVVVKDTAQKK